ncbi:ATP-binding protein [Tessaracoccus coleopterorum]|uniref:ATP-binding protein n=1 Tax=Tessaracoccus coleopterorum TaxID=2714950 RepID=UPI001E3D35B3|nr:ATP-binding protein [Tessaracoccus coleopterorum]
MLASRLPSLLPDLSQEESLEVSAIHSLAGHQLQGLVSRPPYADPTTPSRTSHCSAAARGAEAGRDLARAPRGAVPR